MVYFASMALLGWSVTAAVDPQSVESIMPQPLPERCVAIGDCSPDFAEVAKVLNQPRFVRGGRRISVIDTE
jgi:hypothetical protein